MSPRIPPFPRIPRFTIIPKEPHTSEQAILASFSRLC
jgi:hypothetical protein